MKGVKEIPDDIKDNQDKLLEEIAIMDIERARSETMNEYVSKLEKLSYDEATNVAGLLSQEGTGMSAEFAK
jgi:hypothetical protein